LRYFVKFKDLRASLPSTAVVFRRSPLVVELCPNFSVLFLLICLPYKGMLQQFRPCQSFARRLVQKPLQETFEFWTHILRELDRVFHDEVNQSVDAIGVKRRCAHKKLINNNTERPKIDGVVVGQLLD